MQYCGIKTTPHHTSAELGRIFISNPKSGILGLFCFYQPNKSTKTAYFDAFFDAFFDGHAKKSKQNTIQ